ncbi:MAG TPA: hypothetical protein DD738_01720 [Ruminiclostridium sp.]|nr:hypothetical protein [Ruminiclostridium sp.]
MDWAKVKTILIVIFLILNVFLFITNLYTDYDLGFQSDYARYAIKYLESRKIRIDTKIPDRTNQLGTLVYIDKDLDFTYLTRFVFGHEILASTTGDSVFIAEGIQAIKLSDDELTLVDKITYDGSGATDPDSFLKEAYIYLEGLGYRKKDLLLQSQIDDENGKTIIFNLKYKDYVLFDKTIVLTLDTGGMISATIPAIEGKSISSTTKDILSPYQILVMSEIPGGSVINSVYLGYKHIHEGELYAIPVWRVTLADGTIFFFNAYTGEEL